jgi:acyl-CoA thioester hydrolase
MAKPQPWQLHPANYPFSHSTETRFADMDLLGVNLDYIAEAHFPEHVTIASGILRIGSSSWDIASAAFQGGECKATCITTIVLTDNNGPTKLPENLRAEFERLGVKQD